MLSNPCLRVTALCVTLALVGCATGLTTAQLRERTSLRAELGFLRVKGVIKSHEQFELRYAEAANKLVPFTDTDYELAAARIDAARRVDRGEISESQAYLFSAMKEAEIQQRQDAAKAARQERGAAMMTLGAAILGSAYVASQQYQPMPPPAPPSICSTYVNGRYISTRCW